MGERKVLNKYYPPDFDPAKLPRMRLGKDRQFKVRLMAPFNMRCKTCGHYIYKSTKFLAMKETVQDETYLGLYIFRFYIKCPTCCAEITFKTDPKNSDYVCEHGATRNFEAWRMADKLGTIDDELEEEEEENNPMRALEERTKESRREMDILDALEDIRDLNARAAQVDIDTLVASRQKEDAHEQLTTEEQLRKEEDEAIAAAFSRDRIVRRLEDEPSEEPSFSSSATKNAKAKAKKSKKNKARTTAASPSSSSSSSLLSSSSSAKRRAAGTASFAETDTDPTTSSTATTTDGATSTARSGPSSSASSKRPKMVRAQDKKIGTLGGGPLAGLVRANKKQPDTKQPDAQQQRASQQGSVGRKNGGGGLGLVGYGSDDSDDSSDDSD
ncbi:coiled-coil domain-containing protein 94 [Salpingoeca rosetta]|uniref:Splicing factor YJU2 n=1 Tax=Salpingoeca rosetta (strain ATCC 50818 / BSB-021) TaxID=946362 RepID=F2US86_SALR5|nr:coiled-coil domain-containing protein 94 [Salpingoeca rosetta]EGD80995.1 coiled-coil domain-containing protein 94 [Salpingoeca rosetta]|eukprot:XP_004987865.1 coiled-coil domain-containing protein 94 [Salpingoeca rosetta]